MRTILLLLISSLAVAAGCDREEPIRTYQAPNETVPTQPSEPVPPTPSAPWTVPAGWVQDPPKQMRVASFHTSSAPDAAEVIITRFGAGSFGGLLENINRWRGMVSLPAIKDVSEQHVETAANGSQIYDMSGGEPAKRIIVVMRPHEKDVWFFRLIGPADVVAQQKDTFNTFLKSVQLP